MAEITIIPSVRLYKTGLKTTQADGNTRSIALRQGSLDGACAVYRDSRKLVQTNLTI